MLTIDISLPSFAISAAFSISVSTTALTEAQIAQIASNLEQSNKPGSKQIKYFEKYFLHRFIVNQTIKVSISLGAEKKSKLRCTKLSVSYRKTIKLIPTLAIIRSNFRLNISKMSSERKFQNFVFASQLFGCSELKHCFTFGQP